MDTLTIQSPFDAHVHLRQGRMMQLVVPHVEQGGIHAALVMPNLIPPITTPAQATAYLAQLQSLSPSTHFLPTLYLSSALTPAMIREAHAAGVVGVKSYPRGVTTNSEGGVGMEGYAVYDDVFAEMEKCGMVLNLHGEVPSDIDGDGTCVMNAEIRFLPHLQSIHSKFPSLRIVLEHCTTSEAVSFVQTLPANVGATITPHHLLLTIDGAVASPLGYCKPLAKYPKDRQALRDVVKSGDPKFFLGSDSAPHPASAKLPALRFAPPSVEGEEGEATLPSPCAAGIYTSAELVPLVATVFEASQIPLEKLEGFASTFGRAFYKIPADKGREVTLRRTERKVPKTYSFTKEGGEKDWVIPFLAGEKLAWEIVTS